MIRSGILLQLDDNGLASHASYSRRFSSRTGYGTSQEIESLARCTAEEVAGAVDYQDVHRECLGFIVAVGCELAQDREGMTIWTDHCGMHGQERWLRLQFLKGGLRKQGPISSRIQLECCRLTLEGQGDMPWGSGVLD